MVSQTPFRAAQFKSSFGPNYSSQPHFLGFTAQSAFRVSTRLAFYGAPAVVGVLLFASGIPRVQRDVLQKIPFIDGFFRKEIHPADNPF
ncbi:ubiquinol-cytochrome-c reductase complex subunit-domain-containing protein [Thelonectria olida]|uniref:Ubiquinol-cytochrome-c reductase complex subunit-domain-containing protein n=1 Tax=Thelonectria olida TaxID=1576542 RepID=A0A9P9AWD2_9HYPO|nr:ubiquinol-cytochrome-c reductase complex subunit-domain-containing protein [Thelonectria olida]